MRHNLFDTLKAFQPATGRTGEFYSLPQLEKKGVGPISRLPFSIRILLESVLRNCDGRRISEEDVVKLANWRPDAARKNEIPFIVARILLQDFTGVPLLVDLAAMRSAVARLGRKAGIIEPMVPVDLIIDHSVQVDYFGVPEALQLNMEKEFERNLSRYQFLKWGVQAFRGFNVMPPGIGICHQVNLEYLAKVVREKDGIYFPDTLVGTDSHTTMINGLGILAWGVGGIEAEAGMLGQPVYLLTPDVVGVRMKGRLREGVTAADLVLHVTEMLRRIKVVGKFVEFLGPGMAALTVPDRATLSNMSPEYGATIGFFSVDEETCAYLRNTGRNPALVESVRNYYTAQQMFGLHEDSRIEYSAVYDLNLADVEPCVAGPKRPQDRIPLGKLKEEFRRILQNPVNQGGYAKAAPELDRDFPVVLGTNQNQVNPSSAGEREQVDENEPREDEMLDDHPTPDFVPSGADGYKSNTVNLRHGSVAIAAITSCTNTSNPVVMLAAGLMARKAVEMGLKPPAFVKTSLAPGSRVVSDYLAKAGLQEYLDRIGFGLVGYGCTTCIGNSGPLDPAIEEAINKNDLALASVSSGNRNFEARIHQSIKANFLMSPPLVVAFALAGRIDIDLMHEPLGKNKNGQDIYLRDIWPGPEEIRNLIGPAFDAEVYRRMYDGLDRLNPIWNNTTTGTGEIYQWDESSTYIQEPPFFENFRPEPAQIADIRNARVLAIFGDSVTTDHISPAGAIKPTSPAGAYLKEKGIDAGDFNSYGSRRGNHNVMIRGTFANVRIRNAMTPAAEGGTTVYHPDGRQMSIYEAACKYREAGVPLVIFTGYEYGTGSSRD
jgi:aconitate hydratase